MPQRRARLQLGARDPRASQGRRKPLHHPHRCRQRSATLPDPSPKPRAPHRAGARTPLTARVRSRPWPEGPSSPAPAERVWEGRAGAGYACGAGRAWPIKAAAGRRARLLSAAAAAAAQAEESAVVAAVAALFPARSAQRAPGCVSRAAAAAAAAVRPRPEPDPGECGPATLARPRPGLGDRAPRSVGGPGSRRSGRSHSRSPLSAPACRVPSPAAPRPRAAPPGPPSPPPLAGPGQKMVQKKTAELQGFHRSFKVRAGGLGVAWGWTGRVAGGGRVAPRQDPPTPGLVPVLRPASGAAPTGCALVVGGGQWATGQAPAPWGLWGVSSKKPKWGRARSPLGHLAVCPLQTPAREPSRPSPAVCALSLWVCGVFPPGI